MNKILSIIPLMQSVLLMEDNFEYSTKKKKKIILQGIKNIVGVNLINKNNG